MEQVVTFLYNRNKYEEIIINCSDTCKKSTNSWLQICAQMDNYSFAWKNISSVQVKVINYFQILTFPKMWLPPLKKNKNTQQNNKLCILHVLFSRLSVRTHSYKHVLRLLEFQASYNGSAKSQVTH